MTDMDEVGPVAKCLRVVYGTRRDEDEGDADGWETREAALAWASRAAVVKAADVVGGNGWLE